MLHDYRSLIEEKEGEGNKAKLSDLFKPTAKQTEAIKAADTHRYTLYGGSAGGGKSFWIRMYILRKMLKWYSENQIKGIRAAIFCEDYPSLKDRHLSKMQYEFPEWLGSIKESTTDGLGFHFKPEWGGGVIALRNLDDPSKYLSSEFALIAIDELTKNDKIVFDTLRMRLRWPGIEDTKFIAATNPGEKGHQWVKDIWINGKFDPNEKEKDQFIYVPARCYDNPYLPDSYLNALKSLPEKMRKAYEEGDWNTFEGQYFTEWDKSIHVVSKFDIPVTWRKIRCIDVGGRNGWTACVWLAIDYDGNVWAYREYYATGLDSDEHAKKIKELSKDEFYPYTVIDSSAFSKIGLPETIAEVYTRNGVEGLVPASKKRVDGWDFVHQYLRIEDGPKLKFFSDCVNCTRTIPELIHDKNRPEDVDSDGEDHLADALRYGLQTLRGTSSDKPQNGVQKRLAQLYNSPTSFNHY
ncbi:MAG: phage terminase large subunit [Clostridia bacterium]|jgi:phage terminase large subunit